MKYARHAPRQQAVLALPKETELVYVIGGVNSSNTASLADMARKTLPQTASSAF
jgi:4-hydroxy-3-methylbut-2-enyl diphosphate reductase IspH